MLPFELKKSVWSLPSTSNNSFREIVVDSIKRFLIFAFMPFPILRHLYKIEAFVAFLKLMMSFFSLFAMQHSKER